MSELDEKEIERDYMGMISWTRSHCSGALPMFGSDVKTDSPITIRISQASVCRKLNKNWYHAGREIVEIDMTPVQWAEFLTSGNTEGVPCTITHANGKKMSPVVCENIIDNFKAESEERFAAFREGADKIKKVIAEAVVSGKPMTKTRLLDLLNMVETYKHNTEANLDYFRKCFAEDMAGVVAKAKAEISAYAQFCNINGKFEIPGLPGATSPEKLEQVTREA